MLSIVCHIMCVYIPLEMFNSFPIALIHTLPLTPGGNPCHHSSSTFLLFLLKHRVYTVTSMDNTLVSYMASQLGRMSLDHRCSRAEIVSSFLRRLFSSLTFCFATCNSVNTYTCYSCIRSEHYKATTFFSSFTDHFLIHLLMFLCLSLRFGGQITTEN